ncbi:MAG: NADH:flavin oxidoreductase/NADH oxidase [Burkholderiales bacterium]|jgi:2,4-dienoyl-CoA reductase-like NADH-dependent reductase (Old Yellow Enzyme family)
MAAHPLLFTPTELRGVKLKNRIVISPMCTYSARDGFVNDWHLVHLGKLAQGGAGLVFTEAAAVQANGRITHGDVGIWADEQVKGLARIVSFIKSNGAVAAIQLAHAGRKASMQRPWHGNGPLDDTDRARGESPWDVVAPSAIALDEGWLEPHELSVADIHGLRDNWRAAARRALDAGFEVVELHSAHGYLGHEFLSPISNKRTDSYGGDLAGRMRFTLELVEALRSEWPDDKPLFTRISSVDGIEGGWTIEDSVVLARELKARGVDVVDCSSGGLMGSATAARVKRGPGFQVPFAERIRREAQIRTMAVGLILEAQQAEQILRSEQADLIAIGREALHDPNWPLHAQAQLGCQGHFESWPEQYGWWLDKRQQAMDRQASSQAAA